MAAVHAFDWRDWESGLHKVGVVMDMPAVGVVIEEEAGGRVRAVSGIKRWMAASAPAVVDDFGNLVAVGKLS